MGMAGGLHGGWSLAIHPVRRHKAGQHAAKAIPGFMKKAACRAGRQIPTGQSEHLCFFTPIKHRLLGYVTYNGCSKFQNGMCIELYCLAASHNVGAGEAGAPDPHGLGQPP